ncbi:S8 family serine peptidase [Lacinutrix sp.]|uniref:S8 family serine peptidase n=1 Tax=Lacinutrix sp. TaxID=1937692 RepID=UPI0025BD06C1|nr:S8 family serine peptidase [Lacinutrix sp.]
MVKAYDSVFIDKEMNDIALKDSLNFIKYNYSKSKLSRKIKSVPEEIEYANNVSKWKNEAKEPIIKYFNYSNDIKFSTEVLDNLKTLHPKDSVLNKNIRILSGFIANGYTDEYLESLKKNAAELLQKQLNIEYNEREFLGDNPNDINDINYGYGKVNNNVDIYSHGTIVTGVILKGTPEIKIMPLNIIGHGSSYDKDIAIAIRYAVDNGAKVINMSFGKMNSLHKEWVDDAIKYAEKNNVIIISAAGNYCKNTDSLIDFLYPDDRDSNENEFASNFMKVGGSTRFPNENLKYNYSNYGAMNVDVFAPAEEIYTTFPDNSYRFDTGTSLASAVTSKVAALLFSYYPNLTATEVKQIIMDSGIEYTFPVKMPTKENKNSTLPFNKLSKSGKIVNAYNALIMADSISKRNKRKQD